MQDRQRVHRPVGGQLQGARQNHLLQRVFVIAQLSQRGLDAALQPGDHRVLPSPSR